METSSTLHRFFNLPSVMHQQPQAMEGLVREALRKTELAEVSAEKKMELEISLAAILIFQRKMEEATELVQSVLRSHPAYGPALWCEMMLAFFRKNPWPSAWEKLEARWSVSMTGERPILTEKLWDGSPLHGSTILLAGEGGLGDHMQFVRFAPCLKERGAGRVVVSAPESLRVLLQSAPGVDEIIDCGDRESALRCDVSIPMMSVPYRLQTTVESLPKDVPYFRIPESYVQSARAKLARTTDELNVGICWTSGNKWRSLPIDAFRSLAEIPGVRLYGLGKPSKIESDMAGFPITGLASDDILTTAGAVSALDLVICTDTMMAHLAGGLARPVWLLLNYISDWRWGLTGEDTPWYPTMKVFRQGSSGAPLVSAEVEMKLRRFATERRTSVTS